MESHLFLNCLSHLINFSLFLFSVFDEIANWWASVIAVGAYWILGEDKQAESFYQKVESIPVSLQSEILPKAVLASFKCRQACFGSYRKGSSQAIFRACNVAGQLLAEALTFVECKEPDSKVLVCIFFVLIFFLFIFLLFIITLK